jgi:hypothetical protein
LLRVVAARGPSSSRSLHWSGRGATCWRLWLTYWRRTCKTNSQVRKNKADTALYFKVNPAGSFFRPCTAKARGKCPVPSMWALWCIRWQWESFCYKYFGFPLSVWFQPSSAPLHSSTFFFFFFFFFHGATTLIESWPSQQYPSFWDVPGLVQPTS